MLLVSSEDIADILDEHDWDTAAVDALIVAANAAGDRDIITVIDDTLAADG